MRKWIFPVAAPVLGIVFMVLVVSALHRFTQARIRDLDRFAIPFAAIDCPAPAGLEQAAFLAEVQYLASMPGRLSLLDENLPTQLAEAFAGHPWVEKVEAVRLTSPHQVQVRLRFRVPVLIVAAPLTEALNQDEKTTWVERMVDEHGVLLPKQAPASGLPRLLGAPAPAGTTGAPWGDARVASAAQVTGFLRASRQRLQLEKVKTTDDGVVLITAGHSRILWGRPPDAEIAGEAPAATKLQRLLDYCTRHGDLDHSDGPYEHDVRPVHAAVHRPLDTPPSDHSGEP